jgi:hypothetical protein
MSAGVGADIESLCSKCGDVWHVVVAKVGEEVVKVQCKQCGGYHRYKPVGGKVAPTPRARSSAASKAKPRKVPIARVDMPAVAADLSKPARTYAIADRYVVGERLEHPTFGAGVVEELPEPGKMTVFFATGRRMLVHGKDPAGGLKRPERVGYNPLPDASPSQRISPGSRGIITTELDDDAGEAESVDAD